ncbi:MAG: glycosyltransferase family 2 protein [Niabella sp.]
MKPDVSVIIINYNTFQYTCNCIRSIIDKTIGVSYEIIVVDNASPKDDPDKFKELFPEIILVKSTENIGFAKGNNLGIQYANAEVYLLLNSDTSMVNDAISIAYEKLMSKKEIGVVGAHFTFEDGRLQHSVQRFPEIKYQLIQLFRIQKLFSPRKRAQIMLGGYFYCDFETYADWIWGTFFMIKKEVVEKMPNKKLADQFFMYSEDIQWGLDVKRGNYKTLFTPEAKIIHYGSINPNYVDDMIHDNLGTVLIQYYGRIYYGVYKLLNKII